MSTKIQTIILNTVYITCQDVHEGCTADVVCIKWKHDTLNIISSQDDIDETQNYNTASGGNVFFMLLLKAVDGGCIPDISYTRYASYIIGEGDVAD